MARYCAGDLRAFDQLYARMGPKLYGFFMRAFHDPALAEDLLQTTLLKLHRARGAFRPEAPVRPWLFAIAARVRLDEIRRRRHLPDSLDEDGLASVEEKREARAESLGDEPSDGTEAVRAALAALPESQRVVIHLHRQEGMTFPEIAIALGSSEGAVKLRAFRGYERLRKALRPTARSEASSA